MLSCALLFVHGQLQKIEKIEKLKKSPITTAITHATCNLQQCNFLRVACNLQQELLQLQ